MKVLLIKRIAYREDGTFGVCFDEDVPFCLSVELPWKNNQQNVSCIPPSDKHDDWEEYICQRVESPKFGLTFEVLGVENRSHILFHKANTIDDLLGCIGIGERFESLGGKTAVWMSSEAFLEFMQRFGSEDLFKLVIVNRL